MVLPPELVGLIDYLPTLSESVRRVVLAISAMTSSHIDDKDAVLPDQEGIAWDEIGTYSRDTTNGSFVRPNQRLAGLQDQSSDHFVIRLFTDCGDRILPLIGPMRLAISRNDTFCLLS